MQVRVSNDGQFTIPAPIREQLGIQPGTWLDIRAIHGKLQASIIQPAPEHRQTNAPRESSSRLSAMNPHPDAVSGSDEDLDQAKTWDEAAWEKAWNA